MVKFVTYFYFFENMNNENLTYETRSEKKRNFLLSMKHGINGDNLLTIARKSNDDGNLYKTMLKFVESNETFNDKFREYGKYFNERSDLIRKKFDRRQVMWGYLLRVEKISNEKVKS